MKTVVAGINLLTALFVAMALAASAQAYNPPVNPRQDLDLDSGWKFIRQDVPGAQSTQFNDQSWSSINLPHTWNNIDGEEANTNYYRGIGWYRKHYSPDSSLKKHHLFLKFDGAFLMTDVYVNGSFLGEHKGGFADFVFDATPFLKPGKDNIIAVKVSNARNPDIPPLDADFTFFGGLYRGVHLLVTDPVQVSPLDYGSPGVYLKTTDVSDSSAHLEVTTVVSNATSTVQDIMVRSIITDEAANTVAVMTNVITLPPASLSNVVAATTIANPHLWNGLADPYLYQALVELWRDSKVVDMVVQPLGFRYCRVDPNQGFFLNGHHYDLHGVSMHQDWPGQGWAISRADEDTNFLLLKEIGATALRLSHYEHSDYEYQLADRNGLVLWSEIPLINRITESPAFYASAKQQLIELIRQRYNHPSVICWGVFNEITLRPGPRPVKLVSQLAKLAALEDPTRFNTSAANASDDEPSNWRTELNAINKYFGWYNGSLGDFGPWADNIHSNYPNRCIGVSEYGAGGSIAQHSEDPVHEPENKGHYHPEEYENVYHEVHWEQMEARPFLWCKFAWTMFDFAVAGRDEGDMPGRNDKGLVTYDRKTRKDAFYFYKANWTTDPMVYITGHTFTNRLANRVIAKVYANCGSVELYLNGTSQGVVASTNCIFTWPLTLAGGTNTVTAIGTRGETQVRDSLVWLAPQSSSLTASTSGTAAAPGDGSRPFVPK